MQVRALGGLSLALAVACVTPPGASAGEGDYMALFGGAWAGSGVVLNDAKLVQVGCQAVGKASPNHLSIRGSCGVFLVSVNIAAEVNYDPQSDRYEGTYTGGDLAARITGRRSGDRVDFTMVWADPIGGATHSRLTIVNAGKGNLSIVIDNIKTNAPDERASELRLSQR